MPPRDGGLLPLFRDGVPPITDEIIDRLAAAGYVQILQIGPPRRYELTQKAIDYAETELFPELGVTAAEARAWLRERAA